MSFIKKLIPLVAGVVASIIAEDSVTKLMNRFDKKEEVNDNEEPAEEEETEDIN